MVVCKCPLPVKVPRLIITANTLAMRYSVLVQLKNAGCKGQGLVFVTNNNIPPTVPPRNKF